MEFGGEIDLDASGDASPEMLLQIKHHLEEQLTSMNVQLRDKNQHIFELLTNIEDLKVDIYSRDKTIDMQSEQI